MRRELIPGLREIGGATGVVTPDGSISGDALASAAGAVAQRLRGHGAVLLWSTPELATVVGLLGGLAAGTPVVPLNPKAGRREIEHILADVRPTAILTGQAPALPDGLASIERIVIDPAAHGAPLPPVTVDRRDALVIYTSGTTGPPKGVVLSRAALAANIDALAEVWSWTDADIITHALPLFHVHGLVLGTLGPLRIGSELRHMGSFDVARTCQGLRDGATMLFAVPTMYHRLAIAVEQDREQAKALAGARLLGAGSAPLAAADHEQIMRCCNRSIVDRYGMTETLATTAMPLDGDQRPGYVGAPLPGVDVRVVDDDGQPVPRDDASMGRILVRSPSLLTEYHNRPDATAASRSDGYFKTGDLGVLSPEGLLRLVGRESVDLIKSGGYRIGAMEIETVLVSHPAVAEAAVVGLPDADLGQRIAAWIVLADGHSVASEELIDYVAVELTPHKRPREVHFTTSLPRNAMGKVPKQELADVG